MALSGVVHAEDLPADAGTAERQRARLAGLLAEAKSAYEARRYEDACPIFQQIYAADPSREALLDLAICQGESEGWGLARPMLEELVTRWPTALVYLYLGVARDADQDPAGALAGFERARELDDESRTLDTHSRGLIEAHLERLRESVVRLRLVVPTTPGLVVRLDERTVDLSRQPIPLNPGVHSLEAGADGRIPFSRRLEFEASQSMTIEIPELAPLAALPAFTDAPGVSPLPAAAPSRVPATPSPAVDPSPPNQGWTWVLTGGGLAFAGAGIAVGRLAVAEEHRLRRCESDHPEQTLDVLRSECGEFSRRTRDLALATDALWISGALAVGIGVGRWFWSRQRSHDPPRATAGVLCSPTWCGLQARGRF